MDRHSRLAELAAEQGFTSFGVAEASPLLDARRVTLSALAQGHLADMRWMTGDWVVRSTTPAQFLEGCRSLVVVGLVAAPPSPRAEPFGSASRGRVARYAWGRDYHRVFERRLKSFSRAIRDEFGGETRTTVDYGPLLERPLAAIAGVGWIGKSTMLLAPGVGPWLLMAVVATTLDLQPGTSLRKSCGSCVRCVVACPTGALGDAGGNVDSRLCISYQTIENRGSIPSQLRSRMGSWVFGCDACLESCPVGIQPQESEAELSDDSADYQIPVLRDLISLDEAAFRERFKGRAVLRAKREGLVRNACVALGNTGRAEEMDVLFGALSDASPMVRGHAAWAVARLATRLALDPGPALNRLSSALQSERNAEARAELLRSVGVLEQGSGTAGGLDSD